MLTSRKGTEQADASQECIHDLLQVLTKCLYNAWYFDRKFNYEMLKANAYGKDFVVITSNMRMKHKAYERMIEFINDNADKKIILLSTWRDSLESCFGIVDEDDKKHFMGLTEGKRIYIDTDKGVPVKGWF